MYKEWRTKAHQAIVDKIANDIKRQQDSRSLKEYAKIELTIEHDAEYMKGYTQCAVIKYDDLALDWMKQLTVCISTSGNYTINDDERTVLFQEQRNTSYVIGDTETYAWNDNVNV